jgi:copper chaperone NosL
VSRLQQYCLIRVLAAALAVVALAGCASSQAKIEPPTIYYGEDICDQCGMIISDERFAAASVVEVGEGRTDTRVFDDVGGLFVYHAAHPDETVLARYVHDYNTKAWLAAEDAFYVRSDDVHSPMGHGVAAFETRDGAEEFAAVLNGQAPAVVDYTTLVAMADTGIFDAAPAGEMQMEMDTEQ